MVKKPVLDDTSLTQKQIDASVIEVRKLLDELHNLQSLKMFENLEPREFQGLSPEEIEFIRDQIYPILFLLLRHGVQRRDEV